MKLLEVHIAQLRSIKCKFIYSFANPFYFDARVYADIGDTYSRFEFWLNTFLDKIDVDVMPGT